VRNPKSDTPNQPGVEWHQSSSANPDRTAGEERGHEEAVPTAPPFVIRGEDRDRPRTRFAETSKSSSTAASHLECLCVVSFVATTFHRTSNTL
jgi:hypothetical protein